MTIHKILHIPTISAIAVILSSCGGDNNDSELTSGRFPNAPTAEDLTDNTPRYVDESHNMRYSNGGILILECQGETYDTISLTDIDSGSEIKLCWKGTLKKGVADNATVQLDGVALNDREIYIEKINTKGVWISIRTPNEANGLLVVNRQ